MHHEGEGVEMGQWMDVSRRSARRAEDSSTEQLEVDPSILGPGTCEHLLSSHSEPGTVPDALHR